MHHLLSFLEQLEANNTTERMHAHQSAYKEAKQTLLILAQRCIDTISTFDNTLGELFPQETIFRLAKDTRFSKDKSPYKTNMGIVIAPGGKKSIFPCYYIHLQPGNRSFLAAGLYHPEPRIQKAVRDRLATDRISFCSVIETINKTKQRGPLEGDCYKKLPAGYPKDHPASEIIKQKDRLVRTPLSDEEVIDAGCIDNITDSFSVVAPFNLWLHTAITDMLKNQ